MKGSNSCQLILISSLLDCLQLELKKKKSANTVFDKSKLPIIPSEDACLCNQHTPLFHTIPPNQLASHLPLDSNVSLWKLQTNSLPTLLVNSG